MTTKNKIISGFVCMMVIILSIAGLGYRTMDEASDGLLQYRAFARINVGISNALGSFNEATTLINLFFATHDARLADTSRASLAEMLKRLDAAQSEMVLPKNREAAESIRKKVEEWEAVSSTAVEAIKNLGVLYNGKIIPARNIMLESAAFQAKVALQHNNAPLLAKLFETMTEFSILRYAIGHYSQSHDTDIGKIGSDSAKKMIDQVEALKESIVRQEVMEARDRLADALKKLAAGIEEMRETGLVAETAQKRMRALRAEVNTELPELSKTYDTLMSATGIRVGEQNEAGQKMLMGGSGVGVVLGLVAAFIIIMGLIKVLREMGVFARALAEGDFKAQVNNTEKGEIGELLNAMRQIPTVLQSIANDFQMMEDKVTQGELDVKGDPGAYKGGFAALIAGTNSILNRFLLVLDSIPTPVLMLNKDLKAAYLNAPGRVLGGEDYKGKTDVQISGREDADSPQDALVKAAQTLQTVSAETPAHPAGGVNLEISYTNVPMLDNAGKLVCVVQLVLDLTSVKETQRLVRNVADKAAAIANRVASSSGELSAQVEQVSHGADLQRTRVESTVTAMTEMNATVLEVARSAGQASEQSEATKNKAADGADLVNKVVRSINLVNTVATTLQTNMHELGKQAESIGGVMNVISDIADQTNLLALNAAIEAARAGEAGRGFAVVADEVRKLAEKTMSATHEVGANISAIQNSAHTNIKEVEEAAKAITEATELSNTSGQALKEIVDLASSNSAVVASIATAAEEQSATSEEINQALEEINKITVDAADGMTQASAAVQDLSRMAQELNTVMGELR